MKIDSEMGLKMPSKELKEMPSRQLENI